MLHSTEAADISAILSLKSTFEEYIQVHSQHLQLERELQALDRRKNELETKISNNKKELFDLIHQVEKGKSAVSAEDRRKLIELGGYYLTKKRDQKPHLWQNALQLNYFLRDENGLFLREQLGYVGCHAVSKTRTLENVLLSGPLNPSEREPENKQIGSIPSNFGSVAWGKVTSTYPHLPGESCRQGDPIADYFSIKTTNNSVIITVTDGSGWGPKGESASRKANEKFTEIVASQIDLISETPEIVYLLMDGVRAAHEAIMEEDKSSGTASLFGGVMMEIESGGDEEENKLYGFVFVSVGECKAFRWASSEKTFYELTPLNPRYLLMRDDTGGRIGPYVDGGPDLRNLRCGYQILGASDYVIATTHGIFVNLDPEVTGKSPIDAGLGMATSWDQISIPSETYGKIKVKYMCKQMKAIFEKLPDPSPRTLVEDLTKFCHQITASSRDWLCSHPNLQLKRDFINFPGKLDHTACACVSASIFRELSKTAGEPCKSEFALLGIPKLRKPPSGPKVTSYVQRVQPKLMEFVGDSDRFIQLISNFSTMPIQVSNPGNSSPAVLMTGEAISGANVLGGQLGLSLGSSAPPLSTAFGGSPGITSAGASSPAVIGGSSSYLGAVSKPKSELFSIKGPDDCWAPNPNVLYHPSSHPDFQNTVITHAYGKSISGYPHVPGYERRQGDPICDCFSVSWSVMNTVIVVTDGCSWGIKPQKASVEANKHFSKYLHKHSNEASSLSNLALLLLGALRKAQISIYRDAPDPMDTGTTTLLGGLLFPYADSWGFMSVGVGDCKAFHWDHKKNQVFDITADARLHVVDPTDPGGRLGYFLGASGDPDLRNLAINFQQVAVGDVLILCSDGVHDNLDPESLGIAPNEIPFSQAQLPISDWHDQSIPLDSKNMAKSRYMCQILTDIMNALISEKQKEKEKDEGKSKSKSKNKDKEKEKEKDSPPTTKEIVDMILKHALDVTASSRDFLMKNPKTKLPSDYKQYPGKMDHTTCVAVTVINSVERSFMKRTFSATIHLASSVIDTPPSTIGALVQKLAMDVDDSKVWEELLMTHTCYCRSTTILEALTAAYNGLSISKNDFEANKDVIQGRVLSQIKTWIMGQPSLFLGSPQLSEMLLNFGEKNEEKTFYNSIKLTLDNLPHLQERFNEPAKPTTIENLLLSDLAELGPHLTSLEYQLFSQIQSQDFLKKHWLVHANTSKPTPLIKCVRWTKKIKNWLSREILAVDTAEQRALYITRLIEVGLWCLKVYNFNGAAEIYHALVSDPIQALRSTWKFVGRTEMSGFFQLARVFDPTHSHNANYDYEKYSQLLEEAMASKDPYIPFLEPFLQEIIYLTDCKAEKIDGKVNWYKYRILARTIIKFRRLKDRSYHFQSLNPSFIARIYHAQAWEDYTLTSVSQLRETDDSSVKKKKKEPFQMRRTDEAESVRGSISVVSTQINQGTNLTQRDWSVILANADLLHLKNEQVVIEAGSWNQYLFYIKTGSVQVYRTDPETQQRKKVAILGENSVLGEFSVLDTKGKAIATVVSRGSTELYRLDAAYLLSVLASEPELAARFFRNVAKKILTRSTPSDSSKGVAEEPSFSSGGLLIALPSSAPWGLSWNLDVGGTRFFQVKLGLQETVIKYLECTLVKRVNLNGTLVLTAAVIGFYAETLGVETKMIIPISIIEKSLIVPSADKKKTAQLKITYDTNKLKIFKGDLDLISEAHSILETLKVKAKMRIEATPTKKPKEVTQQSVYRDPLTASDWDLLERGSRRETFKKGDIILAEGSTSLDLFFVLQGKIHGFHKSGDTHQTVNFSATGDSFGEYGLIESPKSDLTYRVDSDEAVVQIYDGAYIQVLMQTKRAFVGRFYHYICLLLAKRYTGAVLIKNTEVEEPSPPAAAGGWIPSSSPQHLSSGDLEDEGRGGLLGSISAGGAYLGKTVNALKNAATSAGARRDSLS